MVLQAPEGGLDVRHMCPGHGLYAPGLVSCEKCHNFVMFLPFKPAFLTQVQVETFPINTVFSIYNFSFRTGVVQEEGGFYELSGGVSLSSLSF